MRIVVILGIFAFAVCLCAACGSSGSTSPISITQSAESRQEAIDAFRALSATSSCNSLLPGAPRGLYCLHCTQSQAEAQSDVIIGLMVLFSSLFGEIKHLSCCLILYIKIMLTATCILFIVW